jgi:hypothetical protein
MAVDGVQGAMLAGGLIALLLGGSSLRRSREVARLLRPGAPDAEKAPAECPPVSVLAPCRGVDRHLAAHARALLAQEYPHYEVLFIVEATADPAWAVLRRVLAGAQGARASLIVAGAAERCSQKVHNLLVGLDHVQPEAAVLAFVDSDAHVHSRWLQALVRPLAARSIGVVSGYRWYVPQPGRPASGLRSAWNAATLGLLAHPRFGFAWGGSCAVRREVFERLGVRDRWERGLSDDLLLTQAVKVAGLGICFAPAALVPTCEPCTWRQLVEWTNRQATIGRVYLPASWGVSLLMHLTSLAISAVGLVALARGAWLAGGFLGGYWLLAGLGAAAVCRAARERLMAQGWAIRQPAWPQALWGPAVMLLALLNLAASLMTRTITWRGISYTMVSSQHVVVHRRPCLSARPAQPS